MRHVLAIAAVLWLGHPAEAHPLDLGYLRIDARDPTVAVALDLHINAAARLAGLEPSSLTPTTLQARAAELADASVRAARIASDLGPCRWTTAGATLVDQTASLSAQAECPRGARTLRWTLPWLGDARLSPTFQVLVKAQLPGHDRVAIIDRSRPTLALELAGTAPRGVLAFVWTGIEHIGAAPSQWHGPSGWKLPDGIDHILFLLALMLAGGSLLQILGIVSGFTLGHSITLAVSALGIARPPAGLIEPLIALSIAFVAGQAMIGRLERQRWKVAACFGLVHGFGFATALNQLRLPTGELVTALFGYNAGVELGQIAIVLIAAPILLPLRHHPRCRPVLRGLAAAIFAAGIYWFIQRLG
jgi:hypothetical protein